MYIPKYFRLTDLEKIESFIRQNSFAMLISNGDVPMATHIPIELETNETGESILRGHISRGNPQWKTFEKHENVLAVFSGPHHYVSSSWYNHVNVPTWNYIAVHVHGKIKIVDGDVLYHSLKTLVDKYEAGSEKPARVENMTDYVLQQMKGIVGFEIKIESIEGKWKLSQNRDDADYKNIIAQLEKLNNENARLIAEEMKTLRGDS